MDDHHGAVPVNGQLQFISVAYPTVQEFGGLAFLLHGNMACLVRGDTPGKDSPAGRLQLPGWHLANTAATARQLPQRSTGPSR